MKKIFTIAILSFISISAFSKSVTNISADSSETKKTVATQVLKGKVIDKESKYPLIGVVVSLLSTNPVLKTTTNEDGEFKFSNVPLGRHEIKFNLMGYQTQQIPNQLLTIGKELFVQIELQEQIIQSQEIVITGQSDKQETNNELATVSARTFNGDEAGRFAGSRNDPARMAANFAGVSGANDGRNDIIIRGNSPLGLLWRVEGVDIPNPSHFGSVGSTGGPVSILNNNTLAKSDFMTGAFPANYGNANSGVFDLQLRNGNKDKREYVGQIGLNGFELGAEGPFAKGKKSSFLINYRYSTLGVFKALGISFGTGAAVPQYQDLTFKLNFPLANRAKITVWGLGGVSYIAMLDKDNDDKNLYINKGWDTYYGTQMGATGVNYTKFVSTEAYFRIGLAFSRSQTSGNQDSISPSKKPIDYYNNNATLNRINFNGVYNHKLSAKNTVNVGYIVENYYVNFGDNILRYNAGVPFQKILTDKKAEALLLQAYVQLQHRFTDKLTLNTGLHTQYFALNGANTVEPRIGVKWDISTRNSISFGAGMHSQLQPLYSYFVQTLKQDGSYYETNNKLGFTKSNHLVLAYDKSVGKNGRIKIETYYQQISNVPVEINKSSFSMLNAGANFDNPNTDSLQNKGTGYNYGIELTVERSLSKGFYFLISNSIFESKYKGSDGIERNTAFNGNFVTNGLIGKEFKTGEKTSLLIDIKTTLAGGRRVTPIDLQKSIAQNQAVYDNEKAFDKQLNNYYRTDFKVTFRMNGKKATQEWALDIQNVLNRKNDFMQSYVIARKEMVVIPQLGIFPVVQYRITW